MIGFNTPPENAWVCFSWILVWLFACGIPLAASMAAAPWVKVPTNWKPGDPN